jgi:hypothetical protein
MEQAMKVYNTITQIESMKFPGDIGLGDVWLVGGVNKLVMCHTCRKFIGRNKRYVCYTVKDYLAEAVISHINCVRNDDVIEGVAYLMSAD